MKHGKLLSSVAVAPVLALTLMSTTAATPYPSPASTASAPSVTTAEVAPEATQEYTPEDVLGEAEMRIGEDQRSFEFEVRGEATIQLTGDSATVYGPDGSIVEALPTHVDVPSGDTVALEYQQVSETEVIASLVGPDSSDPSAMSTNSRSASCYISAAAGVVGNVTMVTGALAGPGWFALAGVGYGLTIAGTMVSC